MWSGFFIRGGHHCKSTHRLARLKKHVSQHCLCRRVTFSRRKLEPACSLNRILFAAITIQQHFTQPILGFGVAEIGCCLQIKATRLRHILFNGGIRNSGYKIVGYFNKCIRKIAFIFRTGIGTFLNNANVKLVSGVVVFCNTISIRIHTGKLPIGTRMPHIGGIFQRLDSLTFIAIFIG